LRSSFASTSKKAVALPVGRSADMRLTRSVDNARVGQPMAKVWDGTNWVLPAQAARQETPLSPDLNTFSAVSSYFPLSANHTYISYVWYKGIL
jgi:hypothetical protein